MYDMYPSTWHVKDESGTTERVAHRRRRTERNEDTDAVQQAMNRRDNGGEPAK